MRRFIPPRRGDLGEKWRYCVDCGVSTGGTDGDGRLWPQSMMVNDDGAWRCKQHYDARRNYRVEGADLNLSEDYRNDE